MVSLLIQAKLLLIHIHSKMSEPESKFQERYENPVLEYKDIRKILKKFLQIVCTEDQLKSPTEDFVSHSQPALYSECIPLMCFVSA